MLIEMLDGDHGRSLANLKFKNLSKKLFQAHAIKHPNKPCGAFKSGEVDIFVVTTFF